MKESIRMGKCLQCGKCCWDCIYLRKDNSCGCYGNRPSFCIQEFPRSKEDLINWGVKETCGYWFLEV